MSVINNGLLLGAGDDGYKISRSVRLRSSASAYFSRAAYPVASAGTQWTMSMWTKRGKLGVANNLLSFVGTSGSAQQAGMQFDANDNLRFWQYAPSTYQFHKITTAVFRDPSAWYHIVFIYDTTLATAADRCQVWVNGVRQTSFSTSINPSQNLVTYFKTGQYYPYIGGENRDNTSVQAPYDGYLTEINFIDGQALTPSSFGETNAVTGVWQPKKYTGTYGNNGYYLNFSDNSGATATTIGKDYSGNGNNWTPNNISVTAGVNYDSMVDSPTVGATSSNYAVLNPLASSPNYTLSSGNLTWSGSNASNNGTVATMAILSGSKAYWEITCTTLGYAQLGITASLNISPSSMASTSVIGDATTAYVYSANGVASPSGTAATSYASGDVLGFACDYTGSYPTMNIYKNGTLVGTCYSTTVPSGSVFPYLNTFNTSTLNANFGQRPFSYTPPTGFVALNTQNLPDATIKKGNAYFDVTLLTGSASDQSITSLSFAPDFLWSKCRNNAVQHGLFDTVRGGNKILVSSDTAAEATISPAITFLANGVTLPGGYSVANDTARTYVEWFWKAGGTAVSNTAGTITSSVSANPTAGFSVVTYTTTGSASTIGHGLGVAPKMIITKQRNGITAWYTYHELVGATKYVLLNTTTAAVTSSVIWNNTAPTSSVFSVGSGFGSSETYVAYCFSEVAGYSKFGSYTGNGSANGPFVFLGFRPRFILYKATQTADAWQIYDTSRNTSNITDLALAPYSNAAEFDTTSLGREIDILSNGFKVRGADAQINTSGNTYIYAAFAENPFKHSLAR